jgi:hypothetical protein|tara:strand:- start:280 stop:870 length:591 start_codon:yes stop_codon:yes gene_type:complete
MENKMKIEQFIGTFPNIITDDLCSEWVKWFNELSEQNLTMSAMEQTGLAGSARKDEVIDIPDGLTATCFPKGLCQPLWQNISECYKIYHNECSVENQLTSHDFKAHRVHPTGGYHVWHHEQSYFSPDVVLAWMIILEAPKRGGETEFLHQSIRIEPKVGQLSIWPGCFTHKHRGNPPLEGQKTYLTGWFDLVPPQQ